MWNDGWDGWWRVMPLATIAFWVAFVRLLQSRPGAYPTGDQGPATPEKILARRFARATWTGGEGR